MAEDIYPMEIEWWENDSGEFNWHAKSENGEVLFGTVQGYVDHTKMIQYVSMWFPHATITPRDGEPESSTAAAARDLQEMGQATEEEA